jgi:hypothetical protein
MAKQKGTLKEMADTLRKVQAFMKNCGANHQPAPGRKGNKNPHPELSDEIAKLLGD